MHLHEYQAKRLFAEFEIAVAAGAVADSPETVVAAAQELGGERWVVKAQVHAGGRGKAGGVLVVSGIDALTGAAEGLLGSSLVTPQSGGRALPVDQLLVEVPVDIERELYLALLVDRSYARHVLITSAVGGMDIEQVAAEQPEAISTEVIDPVVGLQPYQCRKLATTLMLHGEQAKALAKILHGLYRMAIETDAGMLEINPLVVTTAGKLLVLDAKVDIDDNALFRHPALADLRDQRQEETKERAAHEHGLNYVTLDGNIACMVNGAGLAMATMDLIQLQGGNPANFLDVGGTATAERVAAAFKLILSDTKVKAILVNIFGGIVRCDLIAEGILQALREVDVSLPVIVRLEGTNVDQGRELLADAGANVHSTDSLTEAATMAVTAARGMT